MRLSAKYADGHVEIRQEGGYGVTSRSALRAVSEASTWDGKRAVWRYAYTHSLLPAVREAAQLLGAELVLDATLRSDRKASCRERVLVAV